MIILISINSFLGGYQKPHCYGKKKLKVHKRQLRMGFRESFFSRPQCILPLFSLYSVSDSKMGLLRRGGVQSVLSPDLTCLHSRHQLLPFIWSVRQRRPLTHFPPSSVRSLSVFPTRLWAPSPHDVPGRRRATRAPVSAVPNANQTLWGTVWTYLSRFKILPHHISSRNWSHGI